MAFARGDRSAQALYNRNHLPAAGVAELTDAQGLGLTKLLPALSNYPEKLDLLNIYED